MAAAMVAARAEKHSRRAGHKLPGTERRGLGDVPQPNSTDISPGSHSTGGRFAVNIVFRHFPDQEEFLRRFCGLIVAVCAAAAFAQNNDASSLPASPKIEASAAKASGCGHAGEASPALTEAGCVADDSAHPAARPVAAPKPQPKRILGVMPNYRAVSAGTIPPPPTPRQAFRIATQNSFDYSSFVFVGFTSAMAESSNAHPQLGKGVDGFSRYYWRGFVDKTDGNYLVVFALPTIFHQDERYYAMGQGGIWKRAGYSLSRVLVTPNYEGHASFNASELLGRGIAQGISLSYYPSADRTAGELATKYGYAIMRDALTNAFREFWPDIAAHLHRGSAD
jgi:hypothetical protein